MFPIVRNAINVIRRCPLLSLSSNYHSLTQLSLIRDQFLSPVILNTIPSCGFKVRGKLKRRCKDCYFVMREQRLFVLCKTHGRHKQMSMVKDPRNTWILSHATQSKVRPW